MREAPGSHTEAGSDLQAQRGGDGRRPPGRPGRNRRVPVSVPQQTVELLDARQRSCVWQSGHPRLVK